MSSTFIRSVMAAIALGIFSATFPSLIEMSEKEKQVTALTSAGVAIVMLWFDHRLAKKATTKGTKSSAKPATGVTANRQKSAKRSRSRSGKSKRRKRKA